MNQLKLQPAESINLLIRKHWFIIFTESALLLIIALAPIILAITVDLRIDLSVTRETFLLFLVFYLIWFFFIWIIFFLSWTDYYLDVWVVTDERIIDIEQKGIFNREVSSLRLDRIQDITVEINGVLHTLLSFGDIHVQTAGQSREIIMSNIADPYRAKEIIGRLHDQAMRETNKSR